MFDAFGLVHCSGLSAWNTNGFLKISQQYIPDNLNEITVYYYPIMDYPDSYQHNLSSVTGKHESLHSVYTLFLKKNKLSTSCQQGVALKLW